MAWPLLFLLWKISLWSGWSIQKWAPNTRTSQVPWYCCSMSLISWGDLSPCLEEKSQHANIKKNFKLIKHPSFLNFVSMLSSMSELRLFSRKFWTTHLRTVQTIPPMAFIEYLHVALLSEYQDQWIRPLSIYHLTGWGICNIDIWNSCRTYLMPWQTAVVAFCLFPLEGHT